MLHGITLLLKVIPKRLNKVGLIDEEVGEMQFDFRKKTGTRKAMLALKMLGEKYLQMQREVYLCFIAVVGNHRAAAQCQSVRSLLPGRVLFQIKCFETFS